MPSDMTAPSKCVRCNGYGWYEDDDMSGKTHECDHTAPPEAPTYDPNREDARCATCGAYGYEHDDEQCDWNYIAPAPPAEPDADARCDRCGHSPADLPDRETADAHYRERRDAALAWFRSKAWDRGPVDTEQMMQEFWVMAWNAAIERLAGENGCLRRKG